MPIYSEKVIDHFRDPRNVGVIENTKGVGEIGNAMCGDIIGGLTAHKIHCSVHAEKAIKKALKVCYDKNGIEYDTKLFYDRDSCGHCCET